MSTDLLAGTIFVLHIALILFVIGVPLQSRVRNPQIDVLHLVTCFTLLIHWAYNNDACFLTFVESSLRGVKTTSTFMHRLVSPVYVIDDAQVNLLCNIITTILMGVSAHHLVKWLEKSPGGLLSIVRP